MPPRPATNAAIPAATIVAVTSAGYRLRHVRPLRRRAHCLRLHVLMNGLDWLMSPSLLSVDTTRPEWRSQPDAPDGNVANRAVKYAPRKRAQEGAQVSEVEAHITGTVWKIEVEVGDNIEEGDTVVILESMKMEMPVEAEDPGVVKEILVQEGQSVSEGDALVVLE
jgi:acetyl-CoA carboxylase biotin carboxyl carrier protein